MMLIASAGSTVRHPKRSYDSSYYPDQWQSALLLYIYLACKREDANTAAELDTPIRVFPPRI
jgi:hypothetical protein